MPALARTGRRVQHGESEEWLTRAATIHQRFGDDAEALEQAAKTIVDAREETRRSLRALEWDGRLAMVMLTLLPVIVGLALPFLVPGYVERLLSLWGVVGVIAAMGLTIVAALWLHRVSKPPFAARPSAWHAHDERKAAAEQLADVLDTTTLYTVAGLSLEDALERAVAAAGTTAYHWDVAALHRQAEDEPAPRVLAAARARLDVERIREAEAQARGVPVATVVPFVTCILPAILILVATAWVSAPG